MLRRLPLGVIFGKLRSGPALLLLAVMLALGTAAATWWVIAHETGRQALLTPPLVALLLVANLLATGTLIVLLGRRVAERRAERSPAGGRGQLHARLVTIFSILASVPTILLAVIASLLFQYGAEFWFSGRAQALIENSRRLAQDSYHELIAYVDNENLAMANDIGGYLMVDRLDPRGDTFKRAYIRQVFSRSLANSLLFTVSTDNRIHPVAVVKAPDQPFSDAISPHDVAELVKGRPSIANTNAQRTYSLTTIKGTDLFLYSTREVGAKEMASRLSLARQAVTDYQTLRRRSRGIQLRFNAALLAISLLVIIIVVFVALTVADRLVRPVNALVDAAQKVAGGDLTARVPDPETQDEIGTLADAFNRMTDRLQEQRGALISANAQLDSRRALIEAVLSGVTAGVISVGGDRRLRLINNSARVLLHAGEGGVGQPLAAVSPELDALLDGAQREAVVQLTRNGDTRTLAVKIAHDDAGPILTFDDITAQLADQRRAAWSDVARRIAHEIKNPLTPIQLAAERLQRRYGRKVEDDDGTFARLTETIVRQVGDLRRMVDEFSSFARMPKPSFHEESLTDIARQSVFLHEVAHPAIGFALVHGDEPNLLVCDRRQIGQALTNIVKNAVEAIEARGEGVAGQVTVTLEQQGDTARVLVEDDGVGLPVERDRIVEPYMTTRARGTGLGLAIVKKIVEEHFGTIAFADRPGGGTRVTLSFDLARLAALDPAMLDPDQPGDERPLAALTRNRT